MRIRIGNQTAFSLPPMIPFEYAVARGFNAFEWFPDKKESGDGWSEREISRETRNIIRDTALSHDIRQSVHAPWPAALSPSQAGDIFTGAVQFAKDIAASLFNIHFSSASGIAEYAGTVIPFAKLLAGAGILLSIENTPDTSPDIINELFLHLYKADPLATANIGLCLDIGHANLHSGTRNDYLGFIDRLDPRVRIVHVHMHENYGDFDSHLTIFTGPSKEDSTGVEGVIERLIKRNFSGSIILEEWPSPESLLLDARNRLLAMISGKEEAHSGEDFRAVDLTDRIVEADGRLPNWKKKLEWIQQVLTEERAAPDLDDLASIAVYLRFVGTGEIRCREDGTHYRPSLHAKISRRIYDRLAKIISPENVFIVRKIYPWLPSFDDAYMRAEPLTLIRDIAHRGDIPKELKMEIKRTLQNKLHRSAGPEDLSTSAALLERITAREAEYPEDFVNAFKRFHEELKDFFHAGTLKEMLERILEKGLFPGKGTIIRFMDSMEKAAEALKSLELLTLLRTRLADTLRSAAGAEAQQLCLADLRLEDFSFVLLSRLIGDIEAAKDRTAWEKALRCLTLTVENLRLSGLSSDECLAIESELKARAVCFDAADHGHILRLRATLDRCRRLAEAYCMKILSLYPEKAERIGRALGVSQEAVAFFTESDLRGHLVFQLSKLVSSLTKPMRESAGLPPWDTIVPGQVSGRIIVSPSLRAIPDTHTAPVIAVLEKVEGDEQIPAWVDGIIIPHDTPLLSHFAVRARQKGTVFAVCEDPELFGKLQNFNGKSLFMTASAEHVEISPAAETITTGGASRNQRIIPSVQEVSFSLAQRKLAALDEITLATGGAKAHGASRLEEISRGEGAGFAVPPGAVIPFGVMEDALRSSSLWEEYSSLLGSLNLLPQRDFDDALQKLKDTVREVKVPDALIAAAVEKFGAGTRLMVRSSASCEDTERLSGAGLYDSIPNVRPPAIARAVAQVWASLWNARAARDILDAGVSPERIHMAVLLQAMIFPDFSFIAHTMNPLTGDRDEIYLELAVGMGETLASAATPGMPYRLLYDRHTDTLRTLAFASFSHAAWPGSEEKVIRKTVDYSKVILSVDDDFRNALGTRIGKIGALMDNVYGCPLDIEGLVSGDTIYLVQARRQQGIM